MIWCLYSSEISLAVFSTYRSFKFYDWALQLDLGFGSLYYRSWWVCSEPPLSSLQTLFLKLLGSENGWSDQTIDWLFYYWFRFGFLRLFVHRFLSFKLSWGFILWIWEFLFNVTEVIAHSLPVVDDFSTWFFACWDLLCWAFSWIRMMMRMVCFFVLESFLCSIIWLKLFCWSVFDCLKLRYCISSLFHLVCPGPASFFGLPLGCCYVAITGFACWASFRPLLCCYHCS